MNRIGVFCFYDENGAVNEYVFELVSMIIPLLARCICVVNGIIKDEHAKQLEENGVEIWRRENSGYDGEAYRYVLLRLDETELSKYDEIVLFNDTIYGPFYDLRLFFTIMSSEKNDFWGFGKWTESWSDYYHVNLPEHVQSYFLVIKKRMMQSAAFFDFWKKMKPIKNYDDAVLQFEISFTRFFSERGFTYSTWLDYKKVPYTKEGGQTYRSHMRDCVENYGFPFLKTKDFPIPPGKDSIEVVDYLDRNGLYDINMILNNCYHRSLKDDSPYDLEQLEEFCSNSGRVYIYGNGAWGKGLAYLLEHLGIQIDGFIVTHAKANESVITIGLMDFRPNDGVVIGVSKKYLDEVVNEALKRLNREQLFIPYYN